MARGRTPGADPCRAEKSKRADDERLPLSPCGAKRQSPADTQDSEPGAVRGSEITPRVFPRPVQPWGAGTGGERFSSPTVRSLWGSGAARASGRTASPLRKEAVPAPPRAAPTSSRKDSFPKPELGISVLPTDFCVGTRLCRP